MIMNENKTTTTPEREERPADSALSASPGSISEDDLKDMITTMADVFANDLYSKRQEELEEYWHFKWSDERSIEGNIYEFYEMLSLYESFCRRWEEHHNGSICIVERVRDKYLWSKIKAFAASIQSNVKDSQEDGSNG